MPAIDSMEHSNANHGKRSALIFLACLSLALPYHTLFGTETPPTETKIAEIQQIIDLTIAQDYDRAFAMCKELQRLFPAHPMGFFFEAATLQAQMLDYENYQARKRFFALTDKIRRLGQEALHNDSKNSWLYFHNGSSLGYQAYFLGREHHYWPAFREG